MFYKRVFLSLIITLTIVSFCTGCGDSPKGSEPIATSGQAVEAEVTASAGETQSPPDEPVPYKSAFTSTDGSVNFVMDIDRTVGASDMPAVQVRPRFLTGEDARRVAASLFPDADFFEAEPAEANNFSKSEIQAKLSRWSEYANLDSLKKLYGDSASENDVELINSFLEEYTLLYEQAPAENPHTPCQWEMRNSSVYQLTADELAEASAADWGNEVSAQFSVNGIPYYFTAAAGNGSNSKVNMISCYIYDGICPRGDLDERIFSARLCRTEAPSQEQMDLIKSRAETLLSSFDLGQWQVDEVYVQSGVQSGNDAEYWVYVKAVPVLNGFPALRYPQENYDLTDAQFVFSSNGDLISFMLFSPLEIQRIENEAVKGLSIEALLSRVREHLEGTDANHYGLGGILQIIPEDVQCNVTVSEMEYGLSRTKEAYRYVPSILLKGSAEYIGKETTYYRSERPEVLLVVNAADGTIIHG